jgi:hypothetical protein
MRLHGFRRQLSDRAESPPENDGWLPHGSEDVRGRCLPGALRRAAPGSVAGRGEPTYSPEIVRM